MPVRVRRALTLTSLATVLVMSFLAVGCSSQVGVATPTPTKTPRPELPTRTPMPSATAVPPTVVPTEIPPATDTPVAATAEANASSAESGSSADQSSGSTQGPSGPLPPRDPNLSPFTGLRPSDPSVLARRPLAIKVANERSVIPQSGLSKADVVVESRVEFCMTRITAIFQSQDAPRVGSIRSARLLDVELPVIFDAILAFSGAVGPVREKLYKSDIGDHILEQALNGPSFIRDPNIQVPFNLFANTDTLWKTATKKGWNQTPQPSAAWAFSEAAPPGGKPASRLDVPYPEFRVAWAYDSASALWQRWLGGKPHVEKTDGKQLTADNVVVLTANHVPTLIPEHGTTLTSGPCSNRSIEIQLWGEGPVKILRDGKVYEGKWVRPDRHAPFRFLDASGKDIPLKPGNSWWQVVPTDLKVTVSS
jgi:Protein of unknown function (DUF3048) N-terminal domain/Protein of unknown function (DUF3048) C-terminal domain